MQKKILKANKRGKTKLKWLQSLHSFSFGSYQDPYNRGFGKLRVLNDDTVSPGNGFGMHLHENMEIISIPLMGELAHKDSMGNIGILKSGDVQIMSAGTGISHSEYNNSKTRKVEFLQIWIEPKEKGSQPRYGQKSFEINKNAITPLVAPEGNPNKDLLLIGQNASISILHLLQYNMLSYNLMTPINGLFVFVIDGEAKVADEHLGWRDSIGLAGNNRIAFEALTNTKLLLIEIPL